MPLKATLAHQEVDRVNASYQRATFLAERRQQLAAWADFCTGQTATSNVVPIAAKVV